MKPQQIAKALEGATQKKITLINQHLDGEITVARSTVHTDGDPIGPSPYEKCLHDHQDECGDCDKITGAFTNC